MNSPIHIISQVINSFWLAVMSTSLFLLLGGLYVPGLESWWLFLMLGVILGLVAFVPHSYEWLQARHLSGDSLESELALGSHALLALFLADVLGVTVGASVVMLVRLLIGEV